MLVAFRALSAMVAALPWHLLRVPGAGLGFLCGSILRIRRRHVVSAMERAGILGAARTADAMYRGLGTGLLELLWLAGTTRSRWEAALDTVAFEDDAVRRIVELRARGPVLLAAAHTGNWELVAYAAARGLGREGIPLAAIAKPLSVRAIDAVCIDVRARADLGILAPKGALRAARAHVSRGGIVVLPIDQVPEAEAHGQRVPFLGREAWADIAPAVLAKHLGATVVLVAAERVGLGHRVRILRTFAPRRRDPDFVGQTTRALATALDEFVRAHPASWMWLHRRWRAPFRGPRSAASPSVLPRSPSGACGPPPSRLTTSS